MKKNDILYYVVYDGNKFTESYKTNVKSVGKNGDWFKTEKEPKSRILTETMCNNHIRYFHTKEESIDYVIKSNLIYEIKKVMYSLKGYDFQNLSIEELEVMKNLIAKLKK